MSVTKITSTLGEITSNFIMNDFSFYFMNTSGTGGYQSTDFALVGYTSPEKTINPVNEVFRKEAQFPRVQIFRKTIRKGLTMTFDLLNFNPDLMAIFKQGTITDLGLTGTRIAYGTEEPVLEYRTIRLATTREDLKKYIIDIPKAEITVGEQTFGGEDDVSKIPLTIQAVYNPSVSATASIYTELILTASLNETAVPPSGY